MSAQAVVIEREGGHYRIRRGDRTLLAVPVPLFERYEAQEVFPPRWRSLREIHPLRRLFWSPETREFLMVGLEEHPARTVEGHGSNPYRSYLEGFWVPSPPLILLRPFWNPASLDAPFDEAARQLSLRAQRTMIETLSSLRPPEDWGAVLNATAPYLEALGVSPHPASPEPEALREVYLTPPGNLDDPSVSRVFEQIAIEHVGSLFPVLRNRSLEGFHALCLPALHTAEGLLDEARISHQQSPFRPH